MEDNRKMYLIIGAVGLLIALAAFFMFRTATAPTETISTEKVPVKGIEAAGGGDKGR